MVNSCFGPNKDRSLTIKTLEEDAMRLSLYIISKAGFGVSLTWPGVRKDKEDESIVSSGLSNGHTLTYVEAIQGVLHHIIPIIILPKDQLKRLT